MHYDAHTRKNDSIMWIPVDESCYWFNEYRHNFIWKVGRLGSKGSVAVSSIFSDTIIGNSDGTWYDNG